ncbi:MAG TPA: alpha/beta hydrolase [Chlorobaculum parvum]|uniref:Alpha/beta hydrolase n=1 Tax=Chlorobaculum parvum TaxID=274539 RepID=A0A7C5DI72_9CHLB|nr:alpha/beta hydrolase [Chlorobaculum parvum]
MPGKYISSSDGIRIHYKCHGRRDRKPLLLLNGLGGNTNVWEKYIDALRDSYYLVTIDYRGFGHSDRPPRIEAYRIERFIDDLQCVLDNEKIDEHAIVGHSFGGFLGLHHAHLTRKKIAHGIIIQSSLENSALWKRLATKLPVNSFVESLLQVAPTIYRKSYQKPAPHKIKWELEPVHIIKDIIHASPFSYMATMYNHQNCTSRIGPMPMQTLLITGKKDRIYPARQVHKLKPVVPNHTIVEYDDNHLLPFNNPPVIIEHIKNFIPAELHSNGKSHHKKPEINDLPDIGLRWPGAVRQPCFSPCDLQSSAINRQIEPALCPEEQ